MKNVHTGTSQEYLKHKMSCIIREIIKDIDTNIHIDNKDIEAYADHLLELYKEI